MEIYELQRNFIFEKSLIEELPMLEIRPVYTSYEREEYTRVFGIVPADDHFVIAAHNNGRFVGTAYGIVDAPKGTIELMSLIEGYDDYIDRFLLGKAALNYLDLNGAVEVTYTGNDEKLAKSLGFKTTVTPMYINLTGYFTSSHEKTEETK